MGRSRRSTPDGKPILPGASVASRQAEGSEPQPAPGANAIMAVDSGSVPSSRAPPTPSPLTVSAYKLSAVTFPARPTTQLAIGQHACSLPAGELRRDLWRTNRNRKPPGWIEGVSLWPGRNDWACAWLDHRVLSHSLMLPAGLKINREHIPLPVQHACVCEPGALPGKQPLISST
jgi:hypothetical protein